MPGLNLGLMGGVKASAGNGYSSVPTAGTASQAAYGAGATSPGVPSTSAALAPNDPFGIAFWAGITALGLLLLIRHSLPS